MAFQQLPLKKNKKKTGLYNQPLSNQLSSCFLGLVILLTANTVTADGVYVSCPTDAETSWVAVTGKQTTFKVMAACHPTLVSKARWFTLSFLPFFLIHVFSFVSPSLSSVAVCVCAGVWTPVRARHRGVLPGQIQTGHAGAGPGAVV